VVGASTLAECTASANQQLSAMTSTDAAAFTQGLDQCLATSDCPSFSTCLSTLVHSTYATAVCNRLQTCGDLSVVGASTLAECTANANQQLNAMTSTDAAAFTQGLDQCLATSDCPSFSTCLSTLVQSIYATAVCNQLQSCGALSLLSSSGTLASCETDANRLLNAMSSSAQIAADQVIGQCAALSDCTAFLSCIGALVGQGTGTSVQSTTTATAICDKLQSCGSLATLGATTTVDTCVALAGRALSAIPSTLQAFADAAINVCLAMSDCTSFGTCVSNLTTLGTTALGGH